MQMACEKDIPRMITSLGGRDTIVSLLKSPNFSLCNSSLEAMHISFSVNTLSVQFIEGQP